MQLNPFHLGYHKADNNNNNKIKTKDDLIHQFDIDQDAFIFDKEYKDDKEDIIKKLDKYKEDRDKNIVKIVHKDINKIDNEKITYDDKLSEKLELYKKDRDEMNATFVQPTQKEKDNFFKDVIFKKWQSEIKNKDIGSIVMKKYISDREKLDTLIQNNIDKNKKVANLYSTFYNEIMEIVEGEYTNANIEDCFHKYSDILGKIIDIDIELEKKT
jgi:hypothetical protein